MNHTDRALAMEKLAEMRTLAANLSSVLSEVEASLSNHVTQIEGQSPQDSVGPLLNRIQELHVQMFRITSIRGAAGGTNFPVIF